MKNYMLVLIFFIAFMSAMEKPSHNDKKRIVPLSSEKDQQSTRIIVQEKKTLNAMETLHERIKQKAPWPKRRTERASLNLEHGHHGIIGSYHKPHHYEYRNSQPISSNHLSEAEMVHLYANTSADLAQLRHATNYYAHQRYVNAKNDQKK